MEAITREIKTEQQHDLEFFFDLEGQPQDSLRLTRFTWKETLSQLYFGSATLASRDPDIKLNDCIDRKVLLTLSSKYDARPRYLSGIVESITANGYAGHWAEYKIIIRPTLYRLGLTSDARIFQKISVPDIVKKILLDHGIENVEFRLNDHHLERKYAVQYRETDLVFIERLLAEEGIFYYWEHSNTDALLILTDHSLRGTPLTDPELEYNNAPSGAVKGQFINALSWRETVRSTDLTQRDYCFKKPHYNQQHASDSQREGGEPNTYARYNAYGRYKEGDSGKRFTHYQLEAHRRDASMGNGKSNALHLSAGHHFEVTGHPSKTLNKDYLLTTVKHSGQQPQALEALASPDSTTYSNDFAVHPLGRYSWRPKRQPKPLMDGPQIAHIVGPEGEEIYCDVHGRVKVQFPWDREGKHNEHASCWIRVSQGWAGAGWGAMAIPRIGQEVIVDFLEGDPDQPIITGRTYHATNVPPYALPAHKTRMSIKSKTHQGDGFNELRFEDEKGIEQVFLHGQKDQDIVIGHDRREHIKNDRHLLVGNDRFEAIRNDSSSQVDRDRSETIGRKLSQSIGEEHALQVGKHYHLKTGDTQYFQSGKQIVLESGEELTIRSSGGFIKIDSAGITLQGKTINLNSGGSPGIGFPVQANTTGTAMQATSGSISALAEPAPAQQPALEVDTGPVSFTPNPPPPSTLSDAVQQAANLGLPSVALSSNKTVAQNGATKSDA